MAHDHAAHLAALAAKKAGAAHEAAKAVNHAASAANAAHAGHAMMGEMMKNGAHMAEGHMMANMPMMTHGAKGAVVAGVAASAVTHQSGGLMSALSKHPLVVFGLGIAAGVLIHKYRKEIIGSVTRVSEQGKDFVLQQKENLEDIVAECRECEEAEAKAKTP